MTTLHHDPQEVWHDLKTTSGGDSFLPGRLVPVALHYCGLNPPLPDLQDLPFQLEEEEFFQLCAKYGDTVATEDGIQDVWQHLLSASVRAERTMKESKAREKALATSPPRGIRADGSLIRHADANAGSADRFDDQADQKGDSNNASPAQRRASQNRSQRGSLRGDTRSSVSRAAEEGEVNSAADEGDNTGAGLGMLPRLGHSTSMNNPADPFAMTTAADRSQSELSVISNLPPDMSTETFRALLQTGESALTDEEVVAIIALLDPNGTGHVTGRAVVELLCPSAIARNNEDEDEHNRTLTDAAASTATANFEEKVYAASIGLLEEEAAARATLDAVREHEIALRAEALANAAALAIKEQHDRERAQADTELDTNRGETIQEEEQARAAIVMMMADEHEQAMARDQTARGLPPNGDQRGQKEKAKRGCCA